MIKRILKKTVHSDSKLYSVLLRANTGLYLLKKKIRRSIFRILPVRKNKIIMKNFLGLGYGGHPSIIADELLSKSEKKWDIVWLSFEKPENLPPEIRWVKYCSPRAEREWSTAKFWIDNIRNSERPPKRKKQFYIQTWHSTGSGIKMVEADVEDRLTEAYVNAAKSDGKETDLFVSGSKWETELIKRSFWYDGKIEEIEFFGLPTESEKETAADRIRKCFGIDSDTKIVLYAPTFRSSGFESVGLDSNVVIECLREKYGGKWAFIIRLHPNDVRHMKNIEYDECIINGSDYGNIADLLISCDVFISDYSSPLFQAIRYCIPSFVFAPDYQQYLQKERGLYFDLKGLPSPFSDSVSSLCNNLISFDLQKYVNECSSFNSEIGYSSDLRTVGRLLEIMEKECG